MVGDFGAEVRRTWYSPISGRSFVVDGKIKSRHSANAIMKQAGLPKAF